MVEKSTNPDFRVKCKSAFVGGMKLKISELGKVITGNTPSKKIKEFWDKDDVGFVKPDIISDEHIVKIKSEDCNEFISNAAISKARIVPKNSIFVTCIGNIGKIGVATENLAFNQQINAIIPNENVNLDYLCYAIFANKTRLQDIANAPIVPLLNKSQFSEFELEFDMDINTQTRIVHELNTVSNIILKYKQELLLLDELVRARFVEMFGEIEDCDRWESKIWNEVVTIKNGRDYKKVLVSDGGYPVVGTGGEIARASKYLCPENTIVVGRKGSINNPMLMKEKFWNVDTAFGVIPNSDYLHYQYFYCFCKFYNFMKLNKATTLPSTTKADLLKIRINIPPLELQNQFASFVEEVDKSRSRIQKSLEASQELFDSLMQEYFG